MDNAGMCKIFSSLEFFNHAIVGMSSYKLLNYFFYILSNVERNILLTMEQKCDINYLRKHYKDYMVKYTQFRMISEHKKSCEIFKQCNIDVNYNNDYNYYKNMCISDNLITLIPPNENLIDYDIDSYKDFIIIMKKVSNIIINNLSFIDDVIMNSDLSHKDIMCKIINVFKSRHKKLLNKEIKMNIPELEIYNALIRLKKIHSNIINIYYNVKLPVKFIGNLRADFVITIKQDDLIKAIIIEYDGPLHSDHEHPHFNNDTVYRDLIKNNFCIKNKINMLRIDYRQNHIELLEKFMNKILYETTKDAIYEIPEYGHYLNILNNKRI
jgi:hypothetical protein